MPAFIILLNKNLKVSQIYCKSNIVEYQFKILKCFYFIYKFIKKNKLKIAILMKLVILK